MSVSLNNLSIRKATARKLILAPRLYNFSLRLSVVAIVWNFVWHWMASVVSSVEFLSCRDKTSLNFFRPNFLSAGNHNSRMCIPRLPY